MRKVQADFIFFTSEGEHVENNRGFAPPHKCTQEELLDCNDDYLPAMRRDGYTLVEPEDARPYIVLPEVTP